MNKRVALLAILIALFVIACSPRPLPNAPTPIPTLIAATLPPEPTQARPPAGTPAGGTPGTGGDQVAAGKAIFDANCTPCHFLTADTKVGPGLAGLFQRDALPSGKPPTDENVADWIHTGGGGMPAFPFDETQTAALIAFLKDATQ